MYTQHLKPSLFSYSQPHELPFARGILRLYTHTQTDPCAQPLQRVRESGGVLLCSRTGGVHYLKLIFYYHLSKCAACRRFRPRKFSHEIKMSLAAAAAEAVAKQQQSRARCA